MLVRDRDISLHQISDNGPRLFDDAAQDARETMREIPERKTAAADAEALS